MNQQRFLNGTAGITLAAPLAADGMAATLPTGKGAAYPPLSKGDFYLVTLAAAASSDASYEVVRSTGAVDDVLVITQRAVEGAARVWQPGDRCECRISAKALDALAGINATNPQSRVPIITDSNGWFGQQARAPGIFDGRPWWQQTTPNLANLGNSSWLVYAMVDGLAPAGAAGTLRTDGAGGLQWAYTGDTYGPVVSMINGGWAYLQSGTSPYGILVAVRGATAPPAAGATGAVSTTNYPMLGGHNLDGFSAFFAGFMGETFSDIQMFGIPGATSADALKFAPQALTTDAGAVIVMVGTNDNPGTAAAAAATIANIKGIVELARARASYVYVVDIYPSFVASAVVQKYHALVSREIQAYARTRRGVRFVSAYERLVDQTAFPIAARPGAYKPDGLHLLPFGSYQAARALADVVQQDFRVESNRRCIIDAWDSTMKTGALNPNPTLRGAGGVATTNHGITGTTPDSWTLARVPAGGSQTCATSFEPASDGGLPWFTLSLANAAAGNYHELNQYLALPAGFGPGDWFRVVGEVQFGAMTGAGLAILFMTARGTSNLQLAHLVQTNGAVATFTTEKPVQNWVTEPMKVLPGVNDFFLRLQVGAGVGGSGVIGVRRFYIEKVAAPT